MPILRSVIEQVKQAANIEDVVRSYNVNLRRRGTSLWANCPFPGHEEKTPSFCVTPAKNICKCFGCGKGGDAISFVIEMENVNYVDAIKILAKRYNIEVEDKPLTKKEKEKEERQEALYAVTDFADKWFQKQMWETPTGQDIAWRYFHNRGIREDIAKAFHLGYCPNAKSFDGTFYHAALQAGYKDELLKDLHLCKENEKGKKYDFFFGRVIFPILSISNRVIAFGGRILEKDSDKAKYYNSSELDDFYVKSKELYGLAQAISTIRRKDHIYLCEGYMDVISMHQNGLTDAVASCGTSLTEQQAHRISTYTKNITILYDGDKAGIKAATRAIDLLLPNQMKINVLVLPDDDDPDSFARKHTAQEYVEYIESQQTDWIDYLMKYAYANDINDIAKKTDLINQLSEKLQTIPDAVYRDICVRKVATILNFSADIIYKKIEEITKDIKLREQYKQTYPKDPATDYVPDDYVPPTTTDNKEGTKDETKDEGLDQYAKNILQLLLRYGTAYIFKDTPDQIGVAEFINAMVSGDDITFENDLLQQIYDEYLYSYKDENFNVYQYFLDHPNQQISEIAVHLLTDDHRLSKIHEVEEPENTDFSPDKEPKIIKRMPSDADELNDLVPKVVYEYKYYYLVDKQKALLNQMKEANAANDSQLVFELMQKLNANNTLIKTLAEFLKKVVIN